MLQAASDVASCNCKLVALDPALPHNTHGLILHRKPCNLRWQLPLQTGKVYGPMPKSPKNFDPEFEIELAGLPKRYHWIVQQAEAKGLSAGFALISGTLCRIRRRTWCSLGLCLRLINCLDQSFGKLDPLPRNLSQLIHLRTNGKG